MNRILEVTDDNETLVLEYVEPRRPEERKEYYPEISGLDRIQ